MENKKLLNQSVACKRMRAVGLTQRQTLDILDEVQKWAKSSGEEWTIKRLKAIKVAYIRKLAGSPTPFKFSPWISKAGDVPKGPFKAIFKLRKVQKALSALMVYTQYTSKSETKSQLTKFVTAVTSPFQGKYLEEHTRLIVRETDKFINLLSGEDLKKIQSIKHSHPTSFADRQVRIPCVRTVEKAKESSAKNSYNAYGVEFVEVVKTVANNLEDFLSSFSYPPVLDYFDKMKQLPDGLEETLIASAFIGDNFSSLEELSAGRIGYIQEPGYRLRTIANPHPSIQVALSRLGNKVYHMLKGIETDCTFNQDKAIEDVQIFLNSTENTRGIMSIDLSSATDRFPLSVQLGVLYKLAERGLLEVEDVNLFSEISRSKFTLPNGTTIKWETGQPLGVFPSFGTFALTHNMLAQTVKPKFFRILGDDIVIDFDAGVRLRSVYKDLGLVISEDKSIASKHLAEFGGRLISNNKSYVQPKWRDISDRSFIELARNLGPKSMGLFKPRQIKILNILSDVHPDVHIWGLNWNIKNLSYNERIALSNDVMQLFLDEEKDLLNLRKDQFELRDLKWGIRIKQYLDHPTLLEKSYHLLEKTSRQIILESLSKRDSLSGGTTSQDVALGGKRRYKTISLQSNFLDQMNLSCADIVLAQSNVSNINIKEGEKKPYGFETMPGVTSGDPRGQTTLEVAEKKLKPKGPRL